MFLKRSISLFIILLLFVGCTNTKNQDISTSQNDTLIEESSVTASDIQIQSGNTDKTDEVFSEDGCLKLTSDFNTCQINVGDTVTATVILTNISDKPYSFVFGGSMDGNPIYSGFVTQEVYDMLANPGLSVDYKLEPNEQVTKTVSFTPNEKGEYIFYAEVVFSSQNGKNEVLCLDNKKINAV